MLAHIWHTYSLLSHNFSIIKTHTLFFFLKHVRPKSVGRAGWPGTLWIQNPPLLRSYYKNENFSFWRVANSMHTCKQGAIQGPPRPSWHHRCTPIIDGGKCTTRTLKRNLRQSWHCNAIDSKTKSDFLARPREQWAGSKPSLVVSFGHISCSMVASLH